MSAKGPVRPARVSAVVLLLTVFFVASCSTASTQRPLAPATATAMRTPRTTPHITTFPLKIAPYKASGLAVGPDGGLWFAEMAAPSPSTAPDKIARFTLSGQLTEFTLPAGWHSPYSLVAGSDGNLWFRGSLDPPSAGAYFVAYLTPGGFFTRFPLPHGEDIAYALTLGLDGSLWFTGERINRQASGEREAFVGRISPRGTIAEYPLPRSMQGRQVAYRLVVGPDGNPWFFSCSTTDGCSLDELSPAGQFKTLIVSLCGPQFFPTDAVSAPDGTVWIIERSNGNAFGTKIAHVTRGSSRPAEFTLQDAGAAAYAIAAGPDGNMWFTGSQGSHEGQAGAESPGSGLIGRITPQGAITTFTLASSLPLDLVLGADKALWYIDESLADGTSHLGRVQVSG